MSSGDATMPSEGRRSTRLSSQQLNALKRGTPEAVARHNAKKRKMYKIMFPRESKKRKITKENITKEITDKLHQRKREQLKKKARSANTIKGLLGCSGDGEDSCGNEFVRIGSQDFPKIWYGNEFVRVDSQDIC